MVIVGDKFVLPSASARDGVKLEAKTEARVEERGQQMRAARHGATTDLKRECDLISVS
jgi:hypothetical protein